MLRLPTVALGWGRRAHRCTPGPWSRTCHSRSGRAHPAVATPPVGWTPTTVARRCWPPGRESPGTRQWSAPSPPGWWWWTATEAKREEQQEIKVVMLASHAYYRTFSLWLRPLTDLGREEVFASTQSDFPLLDNGANTNGDDAKLSLGLCSMWKAAGCGVLEKALMFMLFLYEWHRDAHGSSRNRTLKSNTAPDGATLLKWNWDSRECLCLFRWLQNHLPWT